MEWYGAFGLMVTLVWLYLEILRLLSKLQSRDCPPAPAGPADGRLRAPVCVCALPAAATGAKKNGAPKRPVQVLRGCRAAAQRRLAMALAKPMVVPVPPRSPVSESSASRVATIALRRRSALAP